MCDLDDDAEPVRPVGVYDRETEQAVRALLREQLPVARLQASRVESVEAANQVRVPVHRLPDPILVLLPDEAGEHHCELVHCVRDGRQPASVLGHPLWLPVWLVHNPAKHIEVHREPRRARKGVTSPVYSHPAQRLEHRRVLSRAGVEPAAGTSDLTAELDERDVEGALHQPPFGFGQKRLRGSHVLGVAVVRGAGDGLLLPAQALCGQRLLEGLHHQRFHHRAPVDQHVTAEGVDDLGAVGPRDGAVDGVLGDVHATEVDQRLPLDVTPGGDALMLLAQWVCRVDGRARSAGGHAGWPAAVVLAHLRRLR